MSTVFVVPQYKVDVYQEVWTMGIAKYQCVALSRNVSTAAGIYWKS